MVRQNSPLVHKLSLLPSRQHRVSSARYGKASPKSPLAAIHPFTRRSRLQTTNTSRFLRSHSHLLTIQEEPEEEEEAPARTFDHLYHLDGFERDDGRRKARLQEDMMDWDDETTLVAMLQESSPEKDEEEGLIVLADKLRAPMSAEGASMKAYLAETVVPAITRIREVHNMIEDKTDITFGTGILTFDQVCKKVEAMAIKDEDKLKAAYTDSQDSVHQLITRLQQAYCRRDKLWANLQENIDKCADNAKTTLEALPADLERLLSQLEKKSKEMDKSSDTASKQKMLKDLLEKL